MINFKYLNIMLRVRYVIPEPAVTGVVTKTPVDKHLFIKLQLPILAT